MGEVRYRDSGEGGRGRGGVGARCTNLKPCVCLCVRIGGQISGEDDFIYSPINRPQEQCNGRTERGGITISRRVLQYRKRKFGKITPGSEVIEAIGR